MPQFFQQKPGFYWLKHKLKTIKLYLNKIIFNVFIIPLNTDSAFMWPLVQKWGSHCV